MKWKLWGFFFGVVGYFFSWGKPLNSQLLLPKHLCINTYLKCTSFQFCFFSIHFMSQDLISNVSRRRQFAKPWGIGVCIANCIWHGQTFHLPGEPLARYFIKKPQLFNVIEEIRFSRLTGKLIKLQGYKKKHKNNADWWLRISAKSASLHYICKKNICTHVFLRHEGISRCCLDMVL